VKAYIVKRLLMFIPTLLAVAVIMFLFIHIVPGDPVVVMLGSDASDADYNRLREQLGLDRPMLVQMGYWFTDVLRGDLGYSYFLQQDVTSAILARLPVTGTLTLMGLAVAVLVGIPAGLIAAVRRHTWLDSTVMFGSVLGLSVPNFWLGLNMIFLFAVVLGWVPSGGYTPWTEDPTDALKRMILPSIAVGLSGAAVIARMTRSAMLDVLHEDYVTTARAKGLSSYAVNARHALRNALIPICTVIGIVIGGLLAGSVVIETVFNLRGIGRLIVDSIARRDYPVLQGGILFVTVIYLTVNLVIDLLYAWLDPRIHYTG
jgi:peptide/nickel transport system permease protein